MPSKALTPEEAQQVIGAYLARLAGGDPAMLKVGASITGVLAKYDGDLIKCPACAGAGRYERTIEADPSGDPEAVRTEMVMCPECEGRGHLNGEPVELLRVVNGKLVEHLVRGEPVPLPTEED